MFVQHILNTKNNANFITVPLKTGLSGAISILATRKIGVVIVSETGKNALGILSERDIIRALSEAGTNALSCLLYTSPSPRDVEESRMPSSA